MMFALGAFLRRVLVWHQEDSAQRSPLGIRLPAREGGEGEALQWAHRGTYQKEEGAFPATSGWNFSGESCWCSDWQSLQPTGVPLFLFFSPTVWLVWFYFHSLFASPLSFLLHNKICALRFLTCLSGVLLWFNIPLIYIWTSHHWSFHLLFLSSVLHYLILSTVCLRYSDIQGVCLSGHQYGLSSSVLMFCCWTWTFTPLMLWNASLILCIGGLVRFPLF